MVELLYTTAGLITGMTISYFLYKSRLTQVEANNRLLLQGELSNQKQKIEFLETSNREKENLLEKTDVRIEQLLEEKGQLREQVVELGVKLAEEQKRSVDKIQNLEEVKDNMKLEFETLAQKVLEQKSESFSQDHKEKLSHILNPLKKEIGDFTKKVEDSYEKEARERHSLKNEIENLQKLNRQMSDEAVNLTRALKGDNRCQGSWGEMILEKVLESSGLRKGHEYDVQEPFKDNDGKLFRPDVLVHLPDQKDVVVDSKVSLKAYEKYVTETDPVLQEQWAAEHLFSVRNHINELSAKSYENLPGIKTLDYVLLFMPVEGAFRLAMELDEELFLSAMNKNIMIVSPSSLLVTLRTINKIWQYEHQNRNARMIAAKAEHLYKKFVLFVNEFAKVGHSLDSAKKSFDSTFKRLSGGRNNLVKLSEDLKTLGVPAKKSLHPELVAQAFEKELEVVNFEN